MDATRACRRCKRLFPIDAFRRSARGWPSQLCAVCRALPRRRGPRGASPAVAVDGGRVLAAVLVAAQLD